MTLVALMTQPLRASHCAAYVAAVPEQNEVVIISPDESPFATTSLPSHARLKPPTEDPKSLPSSSLSSGGLRQRVIRWARGGSRFGMRFDRFMRSAQWRLRYLDRLVSVKRHRRSETQAMAALQAAIRRELDALHSDSPISRIVVFDVFDLPTALAFARANGIPVEVR